MKNLLLTFFCILSFSCAEGVNTNEKIIDIDNKNITSGETVSFSIVKKELNIQNISCDLEDKSTKSIVESYFLKERDKKFYIGRFLMHPVKSHNNYLLDCNISSQEGEFSQSIDVNIQPSVIVESLCSTKSCDSLSGNVINNVSNKLTVSTAKIAAVKYRYDIQTPYESFEYTHEFSSPVAKDYLENIVFKKIPDEYSSYISTIKITAYDINNSFAETVIPIKIVRPLEINHFGQHELAEVYEPVPVTGCIPGTVGSSVQYSESTSETRQNSVSVTINKNWANSFSNNESQTISEGINVGETQSTVNSSSISSSETQSDSYTNSNSTSEGSSASYNTSDGENWSWSLGESSSETQGQNQTESTNTGVNASTSVGVSGEGSLPFIAKASGKVEVSAGVSRGWGNSSGTSSSETNSESRGYSTGGSTQNGRAYGSVQNDSRSYSLSGAYALTNNNSNTISESSSLSSSRVWNMSESISSGKVVTEGSGESISQTIVDSSSSSTTFSYSGYIPRGRFGIFFRQTSRYIKLSEIVTYDLNGIVNHAGIIMMSTWAWAPELSVSNTCKDAMASSLPPAECLIPPCGE